MGWSCRVCSTQKEQFQGDYCDPCCRSGRARRHQKEQDDEDRRLEERKEREVYEAKVAEEGRQRDRRQRELEKRLEEQQRRHEREIYDLTNLVRRLEARTSAWEKPPCATCKREYTPETATHWRGTICNPCYMQDQRKKHGR